MKIATWNVNGIKARIETVLDWLKTSQPDIACLQEIKSVDEQFPRGAFEDLGYHVETHGQKSFNGVALLSRLSPDEIIRGLPGDDADEQARFIEGVYSTPHGVIRVASLYLPNGNPLDSPKFTYKLEWMERLYAHAKQLLLLEEPLILAGDYNVIPQPIDAKNPQQWHNDALFQPESRQAFQRLVNLGFTEAVRDHTDEQVFTFWDYQAASWQKDNGIRIDHLLLSPEASDLMQDFEIEKQWRGLEKPSDHVPVSVTLDMTKKLVS